MRCGGFFVFLALTRPGSFDPHGRGDHHALHLAGALLSNRLSLHAARGAGFSLAPSAQALQHDLQRAQRQHQKAIEAYFDRKDILLNPPMKLQSIEAVKKSVMNHFGIAYVPLFSVEEELQDGSLIRLETELDEQFFPAVCVYHRNKWISPQMQLAFRILHEQLGIVFDEKENAEI